MITDTTSDLRREWDSNPRTACRPRLFKSLAFVRSAIPPERPGYRRAGSAAVAHLGAEVGDPSLGLAPCGVGLLAHGRPVLAGSRVRAEELHAGQLGVQDAQAVGDDLVGDVALRGR